jgi:hypothetical protein
MFLNSELSYDLFVDVQLTARQAVQNCQITLL